MITGVFQSLALLLVICIFYCVDFWLIHHFDPLRASGSSRSWSYTILAMLAAAGVIIQPWLAAWLGWQTKAGWGLIVQAGGVLLAVGALLLHWWARANLGPYYGEREEVQPAQTLVYSGPYKSIRHPIYTSYFLLSMGLFLINPAILTLLGVVYSFWDFPRAAAREEKLLAQKLPGYSEYMLKTGRYLPRPGKKAG